MQSLTIKDVIKNKKYVCVVRKEKRSCFNRRKAEVDIHEVLGKEIGYNYTFYKTKGYYPYEIFAHHFVNGDVVIPVISGEYLIKHQSKILWDKIAIIGTEETFKQISNYIFKSKEIEAEEKRYNESWDKKVMEVAFKNGDMASINGTLPKSIAKNLKADNKYNRYGIVVKKWKQYLQTQKRKAA